MAGRGREGEGLGDELFAMRTWHGGGRARMRGYMQPSQALTGLSSLAPRLRSSSGPSASKNSWM